MCTALCYCGEACTAFLRIAAAQGCPGHPHTQNTDSATSAAAGARTSRQPRDRFLVVPPRATQSHTQLSERAHAPIPAPPQTLGLAMRVAVCSAINALSQRPCDDCDIMTATTRLLSHNSNGLEEDTNLMCSYVCPRYALRNAGHPPRKVRHPALTTLNSPRAGFASAIMFYHLVINHCADHCLCNEEIAVGQIIRTNYSLKTGVPPVADHWAQHAHGSLGQYL